MTETLAIPSELTIYQAPALHQALAAALQSSTALQLNLSQTSELDTAAIQVLIWAQREAQRLGKPLSIVEPNACVLGFLSLTGLSSALRFGEAQS
jgi:anti-sigma B factor antagonist